MLRFKRFAGLILLAAACLAVQPMAAAREPPIPPQGTSGPAPTPALACEPDGVQESGAIFRICMPTLVTWNGDLLVYAHGYVSPTEPVGIPEDQMTLPGGVSIASLANLLGYAFATTSYSTNGLAVVQGMADLADLVEVFSQTVDVPNRVFLVGVSEGGLIAAKLMEQRADVFDGGLAMCGPYGDFVYQVHYFGDFRAVFDYFFPGLLHGSPVDIPAWLMDEWDTYYETTVKPQIEDPVNAHTVDQLLHVTGAAYAPALPSTREETIGSLLWYNVFSTNDGTEKLGGQPFDNQDRVYTGSDDDTLLNQQVQRMSADPAALAEIDAHYQTSGHLSVPLVTLHNTDDPLVPYWHALHYRGKTVHADNIALHEHYLVDGYGHCSFTSTEVLGAFFRMVDMVNDPPPYRPVHRLFLPRVAGPQ
jgi:pimeloyl-ACP methyl ester carboxylesterase